MVGMKSTAIKILLFCCLLLLTAFSNGDTYTHIKYPQTGVSDETMELRKETAHFGYYCRKADTRCLKDLAGSLEQNYVRITSDLEYEPDYKVKVYIYKDIKTFHQAIKMPFAPDWVIGSAVGNTVKMVSPINPGKVHNYAHLCRPSTMNSYMHY